MRRSKNIKLRGRVGYGNGEKERGCKTRWIKDELGEKDKESVDGRTEKEDAIKQAAFSEWWKRRDN